MSLLAFCSHLISCLISTSNNCAAKIFSRFLMWFYSQYIVVISILPQISEEDQTTSCFFSVNLKNKISVLDAA